MVLEMLPDRTFSPHLGTDLFRETKKDFRYESRDDVGSAESFDLSIFYRNDMSIRKSYAST
jgi:hypothetical protein